MYEFRLALAQHLRQRGFALTIVCTLALAIGATTAVFAVVNTVLVRALPYTSPNRLLWITSVRSDTPGAPFTLPEFMDYRERTTTLSGLAALTYWSASLAGDDVAERLTGLRMSGNAFDVLGMSPAAGRLLNDADDGPDAPPVVVLSYKLWQRRYGGSAGAIGTTARINGEAFLIVGVLPPQMPLPVLAPDVVTPLVPDRDPLRHVRGSVNFLRLFGRLRTDTSVAVAQAELTAICRSLRQQFPVEYARKESVRAVQLHEVLVGGFRQSMLLLLAAVILVLAAALANLLSLALVRANARRTELATRSAMGASRLQLARQLGAEAVLVAATGGACGWLFALQALAVAKRWAPPSIPRLAEASLDLTAASFAGSVTTIAAVLLTAAPLAAIAGTRGGDTLRGATRGAIGDRWNQRMRNVMVVGQISAALVLVLATIVLVEDLRRLHGVRPGFDPDGVFQARVSIPPTYRTAEDVARFYERLSEQIAAAPGVLRSGVISIAPFGGLLAAVPFSIPGGSIADREKPYANLRAISPGYLSTVGTRLVQGRSFSEADRTDTPAVVLVSAALADRFLSGPAVGQQLVINDNNQGPRSVEIVGVVENVRQIALDQPASYDLYVPMRQIHIDWLSRFRENQFWMVRTASDPAALRTVFLQHLRTLDPDAAVAETGSMREFLERSIGPRRFNLGLLSTFALTAVVLAVIGLYGLVSYSVGQRASEIGLRIAIGATPSAVQRMILRQAAILACEGIALGAVVAAIAGPLAVSATSTSTAVNAGQQLSIDPSIAGAAVGLLVAVVLAAAWLPARRASRIDPTIALRAE